MNKVLAFSILGMGLTGAVLVISSPQADSLTAVTSNALELQCEDMLRNANGKYKNAYVKMNR
ncbi:hypothetical protein [Solibacillus sp. FSL K6-1554]|uniref:hypothetical protein n=1 Tax=Solibacillus sp. FSL K6-1554 TaxID=2921472 RepID=UPI0030F733CB